MEQDIRTKMSSVWSHQEIETWMPMIRQAIEKENEVLSSAIIKFGKDIQIEIAIEEFAELIKALQKLKRTSPDHYEPIRNVCEEIADVDIMITQLKMIFSRQLIEEYKIEKIERLKSRIENPPVMQAEGSDGVSGAAVGQRSVGTVVAGGIEKCTCPDDQCLLGDHPTCRWKEYYARKSSEGQP